VYVGNLSVGGLSGAGAVYTISSCQDGHRAWGYGVINVTTLNNRVVARENGVAVLILVSVTFYVAYGATLYLRMEQKKLTRITGILYLFVVIGGVFSEGFVWGVLIVPHDAMETARNVLDSEVLFMAGFLVELLVFACSASVAALLCALLLPVNRMLAILATTFRAIMVGMLGINLLNVLIPLLLLNGISFQALNELQRQELSLLFMLAHRIGFSLALFFYGFHCLMLGYLLYRSGYIPRLYGVMLVFAGGCYFIHSCAMFVFPSFAAMLYPAILVPAFVAEFLLSLRLVVRGFKDQSPHEHALWG